MDSPVKKPVTRKVARSAPPYTNRAREEPWEGGYRTRQPDANSDEEGNAVQ